MTFANVACCRGAEIVVAGAPEEIVNATHFEHARFKAAFHGVLR
jgi:hypothetical protein